MTFPHHFVYQWLAHLWLLASLLVVAVLAATGRAASPQGARRRPRDVLTAVAASVWPALLPLAGWAFLVLAKRGPVGIADEVWGRGASWLTVLALGGLVTLAVLAVRYQAKRAQESEAQQGLLFVVLVTGTSLLMLLGIDLFWVQDPFGTRFNTVFRIGFQVWILLSVALAYSLYFVLSEWPAAGRLARRVGRFGWSGVAAVVLFAALVYPLPATLWRTGEFNEAAQTLDGLNYVKTYNLDGYDAFVWLQENAPRDAVVLEAVGEDYNAGRGQVSGATGLQTILGWPWHECRWRAFGTCADPLAEQPLAQRKAAIEKIYTAADLTEAMPVIEQYGVDYVYVGPVERETYGDGGLAKFQRSFEPVYTSAGVVIYRVPADADGLAAAP